MRMCLCGRWLLLLLRMLQLQLLRDSAAQPSSLKTPELLVVPTPLVKTEAGRPALAALVGQAGPPMLQVGLGAGQP